MKILTRVILGVLIMTFSNSCLRTFSCHRYRKEIKDITYSGVVAEINDDANRDGIILIEKENNNKKEILLCRGANNSDFWDFIDINDTLIKNKGVDSLIIKKQNGQTSVFLYPCCDW